MKIVKGNFGECRICDCMDLEFGLPSLKDNEYDFNISDPPYNIDAKITTGLHFKAERKDIEIYNDKIEINKYYEWCNNWFNQIKRITKSGVFTCGFLNIGYWTWIQKCGYMIWIHKNCSSRSYNAFFNWQEPIITFGKYNYKYPNDVMDFPSSTGFMAKFNIIHPHPKPYNMWLYLIRTVKPISVLDQFAGSGLTAEICESLGLKYLCYEINPAYIPDIELRIKMGIQTYEKPIKLGAY